MRLQFIFNNKEIKITTILFKNITPILNIDKIVYFKETSLFGKWKKKIFRYSFDNVVWSNWNTLTQQALINIKFTTQAEFYMEVSYVREAYNIAGINDFYLFYDSTSGTPPDPSAGIIDADLLQGEPGSYYLDRANFTGAYTDLRVDNIGDASAVGVYDGANRIDSSMGTELFFKKLLGLGGISVTDTSSGEIAIDASGVGGGSSYSNPDPVVQSVGGIKTGETFFDGGKDFAETMYSMFYPVLYPTLSPPYNTLSMNQSSLQMINSTIDIRLTATFNRGSISPPYGTNGLRSGNPNTYNYGGNSILHPYVPETSLINNQDLIDYKIKIGTVNNTWTSYVDYDGGEQPKDSKGNDFDVPEPSGFTSTESVRIEGVYPLWAKIVDINTFTALPLVSMVNANGIEIILVTETDSTRGGFDIPTTWENSRSLKRIETQNSFTGAWELEGGTAATSLAAWEVSGSTHNDGENTLVPYNRRLRYMSGDVRDSVKIKLIF